MSYHSYPPLPDVSSILVMRPNAIGDFMFALPALHALRYTYPKAKIVFLGKQWHADFLHNRPGPVDEVIVMPPVPGIGAPHDAGVDPEPGRRFAAAIRKEKFDIAAQMYGGGRYSNPYLLQFGAKLTIGMKTSDATPLDRWTPHGEKTNRRLELLQVAALVGAAPPLLSQEIAVTPQDRREAAALIPYSEGERLVILHPGASEVRRRWPPERFAAVADTLANKGAVIVISATEEDRHLSGAIVDHMHHDAIDLTGKLPLSALCGLLERAVMMVANDTGPLHLALSIGTRSVGIFWLTNLLESCPLRQDLLQAGLSVRLHCPVCNAVNHNSRCKHDICFVDDVTVEEVTDKAMELFDQGCSMRPAKGGPVRKPHAFDRLQGPRRSGAVAGRGVPNG